MSALKQRVGKLGLRAGLLAGASAAVMAISGIGASSALAVECPVNTTVKNIEGKGASLQKEAQKAWTGREVLTALGPIPHTALVPSSGYASKCTEPTVSYTSVGSGAGLAAFRYTGVGKIENGNNGVVGEHTMSFAASDDGPTTAQIENAQNATTGAKALIIPVTETAISVVVHPPASCTLKFDKTHGITYKQLTQLWGGKEITKWEQLTNAEPVGAGCKEPIVRVVRSDTSGTTFQFKNYLATLKTNGGVNMPCELKGFNEALNTEPNTNEWANMKAIHTETGTPNLTWPEKGNCKDETISTVERKSGGGGIAAYVAATAGTIGYAALPDAKANSASVAWLQNKSAEGVTYAAPEAEPEEGGKKVKRSNCGNRVYTVPTPGRPAKEGGTPPAESGESVDWSKTFGASPTVGGTLYPLCTLSYDLSWTKYEKAGEAGHAYKNPTEVVKAVRDYLINWVLGEAPVPDWYQPLPNTPTEPEHNVLGAAKLAAGKIG
jgi:ABC-type phosphate transport system substrate-binding protein